MTIETSALSALRGRLLDLRADLLAQLTAAEHTDAGLLALVGNVSAALDALDTVPDDAAPAQRVVVVDDGHTISLALFTEAGRVAAVALDPVRAVQLANRLLDAAA